MRERAGKRASGSTGAQGQSRSASSYQAARHRRAIGHVRSTLGWVSGFLLTMVCLVGCGRDAAVVSADGRRAQPLPVVATYSVLGEWVERVGGEHLSVTTLVGRDGDAHTYEPTPQDSAALARAALVFENGLGFEVWLDRLFTSSGSRATRCVVTRGIVPREWTNAAGHREQDPHVWHSPALAILMVRVVRDALREADPLHADVYAVRAAAYETELRQLQSFIAQEVRKLPPARRRLVTTHDTFGYFADEYGFVVSSVLGSGSSETTDPNAGELADVVERIRAEGVPAIFAENILNPKLTQQVAREAGVQVIPSLYTDALGPLDSPAESYPGMIRFNVRTIVEALR